MSYRVEIDRPAQKAVTALDGAVRLRVIAALRALADEPRPAGCVKLAGRVAWRIRIVDYRVIYEIQDDVLVVLVVAVGHRREIYR